MIVSMVFTCMPQMAFEASAVEPIAKIGNEPYFNFGSLADDIDAAEPVGLPQAGMAATQVPLQDGEPWDRPSRRMRRLMP